MRLKNALTMLSRVMFVQFADLALAEEMSRAGRSTHVLYYLAVRRYLSQQYKDALSHLREVEYIYGLVRSPFSFSFTFIREKYFNH